MPFKVTVLSSEPKCRDVETADTFEYSDSVDATKQTTAPLMSISEKPHRSYKVEFKRSYSEASSNAVTFRRESESPAGKKYSNKKV